MQRIRPTKILPYFWLIIPTITVLVSAQAAYRHSLTTEEYAYACDAFGYLRMAKEIRQAASRLELPQFKLESEQTRQLIDFMKSQNVPLPLWEEVVAPHAHHYFPHSGYVGVQYPPGTGLTLAMFSEGRAVYGLNRLVVFFLLMTGLLSIFIAAWKRAWASVALAILAIQLGLSILGRIGAVSFSINSVLVPILASEILAFVALGLSTANRLRLAWLASFSAGLLLGFAVLIRLPTILMLPGLLLLFWPQSRAAALRTLAIPLALGVVLIGILPVLIYQQEIAGGWYLPTYGRIDASPPTLDRITHNFSYYFGDGFAAQDNWALLYALIGFSGLIIINRVTRRSQINNRLGLSCTRLGLAGLTIWLVPTLFFLSHAVAGLHYAMPAIFGAVALIGLGSLGIETTARSTTADPNSRQKLRWIGWGLVVFSSMAALNHARLDRTTTPAPPQPVVHTASQLPAELSDKRSWIWADLLTGTLWYYDHKPAFKIQFTDDATRAMIFRFVFERGDRQYLIQDSERMQRFMDQIIQLGGRLEPRGQIEGSPFFLIQWPPTGPFVGNEIKK